MQKKPIGTVHPFPLWHDLSRYSLPYLRADLMAALTSGHRLCFCGRIAHFSRDFFGDFWDHFYGSFWLFALSGLWYHQFYRYPDSVRNIGNSQFSLWRRDRNGARYAGVADRASDGFDYRGFSNCWGSSEIRSADSTG